MKTRILFLLIIVSLCTVAEARLIARYSFEGNTSEGGVWSGTTGNYVTGVVGLAAAFDGLDDMLDLGQVLVIGTQDFSIAFWVMFQDGPPDQQILSTGTQGQSGLIGFTYANSNTKLLRLVTQEIVNGSTQSDNLYTQDEFEQNEWLHVVVTREGSNGAIYINGELQNSESDLRPGDLGSGNWRLGFGHQSAFAAGAVDELLVFDHALDQDDVDDILSPSQGIASIKLKEDPLGPGEVVVIAKGFIVDPPAGQSVQFDATLDCNGIMSAHSCTISSAVPLINSTSNGVRMRCTYVMDTVNEARIRLRTRDTVFEGDQCFATIMAESNSDLLMDAEVQGSMIE